MQTNRWDVLIREVGSCLESLNEVGCGLNGACAKAGIELYPVSFLLKTFQSFWLFQILRMAFRSQLGSQETFSGLALLSYIKLNCGQGRPRTHLEDPLYFITYGILLISIFLHGMHSSSIPQNSIFSWNKVKWYFLCDAPGSLMPLLPEVLLHFVLSVFKPSINSLRIGTVPYIWNWSKTDQYVNSGLST